VLSPDLTASGKDEVDAVQFVVDAREIDA